MEKPYKRYVKIRNSVIFHIFKNYKKYVFSVFFIIFEDMENDRIPYLHVFFIQFFRILLFLYSFSVSFPYLNFLQGINKCAVSSHNDSLFVSRQVGVDYQKFRLFAIYFNVVQEKELVGDSNNFFHVSLGVSNPSGVICEC